MSKYRASVRRSESPSARRMKKIGLFGTRYTMQGRFYPEVFSRAGLQIIVPNDEEQSYIHEKYLGELLNKILRDAGDEVLPFLDTTKIHVERIVAELLS